jgi:hypothetical protein
MQNYIYSAIRRRRKQPDQGENGGRAGGRSVFYTMTEQEFYCLTASQQMGYRDPT